MFLVYSSQKFTDAKGRYLTNIYNLSFSCVYGRMTCHEMRKKKCFDLMQ